MKCLLKLSIPQREKLKLLVAPKIGLSTEELSQVSLNVDDTEGLLLNLQNLDEHELDLLDNMEEINNLRNDVRAEHADQLEDLRLV